MDCSRLEAKGHSKGIRIPKGNPINRSSNAAIGHRTYTKLLSDPRLQVANAEMLQAHEALRSGHYDDVITVCASAFESLFKDNM